MGKKRSEVWNHFSPIEGNLKALCQYCNSSVSILGGSISNLTRHLKKKHSKISLARLLSGDVVSFSEPPCQEKQAEADKAPIDPLSLVEEDQIENNINVAEKSAIEFLSKPNTEVLSIKEPSPSRKNKSTIWDHFSKYQSADNLRRIGKCHYCPKIVSAGGGISNLRRHLLRKHANVLGETQSNTSNSEVVIFHYDSQEMLEEDESSAPAVVASDSAAMEASDSAAMEASDSAAMETSNSTAMEASDSTAMEASASTQDTQQPSTVTVEVGASAKPSENLRRSRAWTHFTRNESNTKAKCHYCGTQISICYGSLGNLFRHLRKKHPKIRIAKAPNSGQQKAPKTELVPVVTQVDGQVDQITFVSKPVKASGPGKRVSDVWKHFTKLRNADNSRIRGECHYCKKLVSASAGSVSNLKRHLRKKHPAGKINDKESSAPKSTSSFVSPRPVLKSNSLKEEFIVCDDYMPQSSNMANPLILKLSAPGPSFGDTGAPLSADKKKRINKQLVKFICKGFHQPSAFLEGEGFKDLMHALNPAYELISLEDFKNSLLPQTFEEVVHDLQGKLNQAAAICLSTEVWTTSKEKHFATVTAHYLVSGAQDLQQHSSVLSCSEFFDSYASENIAVWLQTTVIEWNLENKVVGILTDDSTEMTVAAEFCNWRHMPCFAQTLNSIVKQGLGAVDDIVVKVRTASAHIRSHPLITNNFNDTQKQLGLPKFKLKEDNPFIWRTTCKMLERFLLNKDCIIPTLTQCNYNEQEVQHLNGAWEMIDAIIKILNLFDEVVADLSAETVVLSRIPILLRIIIDRLSSFIALPNEVEVMRSVILTNLNAKFNLADFEKDPLIGQMMLLDPRFKKEGFSSEDHFSHVKSAVIGELGSLQLSFSGSGFQNATSAAAQSSSLWADFDKLVKQSSDESNQSSGYIAEMENYLAEALIPRMSNPLVWWNDRKAVYPALHSLMLKKLCTPAAAVPFERLFSEEGSALTNRRFLLNSSKLVPMMAFLHQNL